VCNTSPGISYYQEVSRLPYASGLCEVGMRAIKQIGKRYDCPVCGYTGLEYPPTDYTICPCCGVEFGYETAGRSFYELRNEWVNTGAHWTSRVDPTPWNWNPWLQLSSARLPFTAPFRATEVHVRPQNWTDGFAALSVASNGVSSFVIT
jgi:hypothetical protein